MQTDSTLGRAGNDAKLLARVGALYYVRGLTQADIAKRLHCSRPQVSRLLRAARDAGIVRIVVTAPHGGPTLLEAELETRFGLREVRIISLPRHTSPEEARWHIGVAAARDFVESLRDGHVVGVAGGDLLASMIDSVGALVTSNVRVVQVLVGERTTKSRRTLASLVHELAHRVAGEAVTLPAGSMVADGPGAVDSLDMLYVEMTPGVAINVERIRRTARVVAVVYGPEQASAIARALRTCIIDTVITDALTASAIAALPCLDGERR